MNYLIVNPVRMRTTRRMLGMTRAGLSLATDGRVSVEAIDQLEHGERVPDDGPVAASLAAALNVPYEFLLSQSEHQDYQETPSWRAVKKISAYVSEGLSERLTYYTDKYRDLEEYVERREIARSDLSPAMLELRTRHNLGTLLKPDDIERYAKQLREHVCISLERSFTGHDSITEVMESFGIKVACWPLPPGVSGLSMTYGEACDGVPPGAAVLVNRNHPVERRRFSLAHEWGHLILPQTGNWQDDEMACNRFAGALLMPEDDLRDNVTCILGGPITQNSVAFNPKLVALKCRYGVSIAALLRRCYDIGLVATDDLYKLICRRLGQRGWFRCEPEPRWQGKEETDRFEQLINKLDDEDRQRGLAAEWRSEVQFLEAV